MLKQKNPFIYGVPVSPSHFVGREQEVADIFSIIGGHGRGSISIVGEHRFGATSLLFYISDPEVAQEWGFDLDQYFFVYLNLQSIGRFTPARFWHRVLDLAPRQLKDSKIKALIEQLQNREEIQRNELEPRLEKVHGQNLYLILLLDEFEWAIRTDIAYQAITAEFLSQLRSLFSHPDRVLSIVVATSKPLSELCHDLKFMSSPFYHGLTPVLLKPFTKEEAEELISRALVGTGVEFSEEDSAFVYEVSKGNPYRLQNACFKLFDKKLEFLRNPKNTSLGLEAGKMRRVYRDIEQAIEREKGLVGAIPQKHKVHSSLLRRLKSFMAISKQLSITLLSLLGQITRWLARRLDDMSNLAIAIFIVVVVILMLARVLTIEQLRDLVRGLFR